MRRRRNIYGVLALLVLLLSGCGEEDYVYPSAVFDFLTAETGPDGRLETLVTDSGQRLPVGEDQTGSQTAADTAIRVVANYEVLPGPSGTRTARLYAVNPALSPLPMPEDYFLGGIKTDPSRIEAIWMGLDYLNIMVQFKAFEKTHSFHFVERGVTADNAGRKYVDLLLYHDADGDIQAYNRRGYLSIPLKQYAADGTEQVEIRFCYVGFDGKEDTHYRFVYEPETGNE